MTPEHPIYEILSKSFLVVIGIAYFYTYAINPILWKLHKLNIIKYKPNKGRR